MKKTLLISIGFLLVLSFSMQAATIRSNGTGGGNWNSTLSWTGGVIPGAGDVVRIDAGDSIVVSDTRTCTQLVMLMDAAGTAALTITSSRRSYGIYDYQ